MTSHDYPRLMLLGFAAALLGCGGAHPAVYPVHGSVQLDGAPLPGYVVLFRPEAGPLATGVVDSDGSFTLRTALSGAGAVAGVHAIALGLPEKQFSVPRAEIDLRGPAAALPPLQPIPPRYLSFDTSGLSVEVLPQSNELRLELQSE